jgi:hypothetical protein
VINVNLEVGKIRKDYSRKVTASDRTKQKSNLVETKKYSINTNCTFIKYNISGIIIFD